MSPGAGVVPAIHSETFTMPQQLAPLSTAIAAAELLAKRRGCSPEAALAAILEGVSTVELFRLADELGVTAVALNCALCRATVHVNTARRPQ